MKLFQDLFYAVDDKGVSTLDLSRVLMMLGCVAFIAQAAVAVLWRGQPFDAQAYGIGFAAIMAGGGFGIKHYNQSTS